MRKFKTIHFWSDAKNTAECDTNGESTTRMRDVTCHKCVTSKTFQDIMFTMNAVTREEASYDRQHAAYSFSFR